MQQLHLGRYFLAAFVVVFAGCVQSVAPITPLSDAAASGMGPQTASEDLLYVANRGSITIYSYPQGNLVATLALSYEPNGLCSDSSGNVFITSADMQEIFEYAHGGKHAIRTLKDPGYMPRGCASDPVTGNLAVANYETSSAKHPGNIEVYPKATGNPNSFVGANLHYYLYCSYDTDGNLYVDGESSSTRVVVAELPKDGNTLSRVDLSQSIGRSDGIQWDGTYVAVGDESTHAIYEFAIKRSSGMLKRATFLGGTQRVGQFDIDGLTVIVPNSNSTSDASDVLFFPYPRGGEPIQTITNGVLLPSAAVISVTP
jgi:DNA-binding beta-propeller fold protein YncE